MTLDFIESTFDCSQLNVNKWPTLQGPPIRLGIGIQRLLKSSHRICSPPNCTQHGYPSKSHVRQGTKGICGNTPQGQHWVAGCFKVLGKQRVIPELWGRAVPGLGDAAENGAQEAVVDFAATGLREFSVMKSNGNCSSGRGDDGEDGELALAKVHTAQIEFLNKLVEIVEDDAVAIFGGDIFQITTMSRDGLFRFANVQSLETGIEKPFDSLMFVRESGRRGYEDKRHDVRW